jgi:hypothetical protein
MAGHSCAEIHVLADALQTRRLVEISCREKPELKIQRNLEIPKIKPEHMHFLITSQFVPQDFTSSFCCTRISFNCWRTSLTLRRALMWMKCSFAQFDE